VSANVTLLTSQKGLHQELTFGPKVRFNSLRADSRVDGSLVAQVSLSNIAGSSDSGHFNLSLFTQAALQRSLSNIGPVTGSFASGVQLQFVIKKDLLSLAWQGMPFLNIDCRGGVSTGAQAVTGMSLQVFGF
jgi:hypothetical protein